LNKRFGEILVSRGVVSPEDLQRAVALQSEHPDTRIGTLLLRLGMITSRDIATTLSEQLSLPLLSQEDFPEFPILEERVSTRFLHDAQALPLHEDEERVVIGMTDPLDTYTIEAFRISVLQHPKTSKLPTKSSTAVVEVQWDRLSTISRWPRFPILMKISSI
jgi:general secretion pathway protein E